MKTESTLARTLAHMYPEVSLVREVEKPEANLI